MDPGPSRPLKWVLVYGAASACLYALLFLLAGPILAVTARGKLYAFLVVAIAFVFSLVHGAFTGYFWDVLGVQAKRKRDP